MAETKLSREPDNEERVVEIAIERLRDFSRHPFKVEMDAEMVELKDSIEKYGILNPLIVRPVPDGVYEIISGHRRKFAAEQLGYRKVPVIIRYMRDEDAVIAMVDSNLQREQVSPSEKAFAYKMKYEAMIKNRSDEKSRQHGDSYKGEKTIKLLADQVDDSPRQIQRYIRITNLIPELLQRLDADEIAISPAVELTFLTEEEQKMLVTALDMTQSSPSLSQAQRIKALSQDGNLTSEEMESILGEVKKGEVSRVIFTNEQLHRYFPKDYGAERMKREILTILKLWMERYKY